MRSDLLGRAVLCEGQIGVARDHDVIVIVAREVLTLVHCRFIDSFVSDVVASGVPAVGVLYVVRHDQAQRSNEVRHAITEVILRHKAHLKGFGLVHSGTGFVAAAQRGLLTMVATASGQRHTVSVFSDVESGGRWLLPRMNHAVNLRSLQALVDDVAAALDRQSA